MLHRKHLLEKIKEHKAKRVLIQIPEGLKSSVQKLSDFLEKNNLEVLISVEPCYGACDLRNREAMALGCDMIIHIGHTDFGLNSDIPVIYEDYEIKVNPVPLLKKNIFKLKPYKKIALLSTIQFLSSLDKAKRFLEKQGKEVVIGRSVKGKPGQVLGCDYSAALSVEAECYLFIGSGKFHPLGLAMDVEEPVFFLDIERREMINLEKEKERMQRIKFAHLYKAKSCKRFGILLSTKPGQMKTNIALHIKKKLNSKKRKAWILVADEITPEKLLGLKLDCLVDCACPRIADDFSIFKKPVLKPEDIDRLWP